MQVSVLAGIVFRLLILFTVGFDSATAGAIVSGTACRYEQSAALHAGSYDFHSRGRLLFNGDLN